MDDIETQPSAMDLRRRLEDGRLSLFTACLPVQCPSLGHTGWLNRWQELYPLQIQRQSASPIREHPSSNTGPRHCEPKRARANPAKQSPNDGPDCFPLRGSQFYALPNGATPQNKFPSPCCALPNGATPLNKLPILRSFQMGSSLLSKFPSPFCVLPNGEGQPTPSSSPHAQAGRAPRPSAWHPLAPPRWRCTPTTGRQPGRRLRSPAVHRRRP